LHPRTLQLQILLDAVVIITGVLVLAIVGEPIRRLRIGKPGLQPAAHCRVSKGVK
jgi:hypothetical protein